jgi:predicted ATP-dependent protease
MKREDKYKLSTDKLSSTLPESWLHFKTTEELSPSRGMIGQDRAMRAVDIGLKIRTRGFNIFAVGEPGSGKTSTLERILKERARSEPVPEDLCYVYNFNIPDHPRPLLLPAGKGRAFAKDMERIIKELERMIPRVLSEGSFGHIRAGILAETRKRAGDLLKRASKAADKLGLKIEEDADNLRVIAIEKGVPLDEETFEKLPKGKRNRIEANLMAFQEHLDAFTYGRRQLEREHRKQMIDAEIRMVTPIVKDLMDEVASRYRRYNHAVFDFLMEVKDSILENHRAFMPQEEEGDDGDDKMADEPPPIDPHRIYQVNVLVDRTGQKGAPVVLERVPTAANLSGYFEYRETQGGLVTDHTMIRGGALHQACGGYLLLQAGEILSHENAWDSLKRAIRHREIRVDEGFGPGDGRPRIAGMMKPGAAALNLKVILVGSPEAFFFLRTEDEEFGRLFKIKADFEPSMARTRSSVGKLAAFLGQVCREEDHLPLHRTAVSRLVEFASRQAGHKGRMTTRRAALLDLLAEANAAALKRRARAIHDTDVQQALNDKAERDGALMDALDREIREGTILIQTSGETVGQVNGIALYDMVGTSFGIPVRITARTYVGRRGVVNIDREVRLSGAIHDKGALILIGHLGGRYARQHPLGFSASITFEQSYDEIDGDSASAAELYALLSSLSGCPIRQGIAVTGSVNQLGEIQPIGGVNEKIEGVFRVSRIQGLKGKQGVVIPKANVKNLMLGREVIDAVRAGKFNIYAITSIDEGIGFLTGRPAGRRRKDGTFTPGSINDLVQRRLAELGTVIRKEGIITGHDGRL